MFKFVHLFGHLFLRAAGDVEGKVAGLGDLVEHKSLLAVHDVAVAPVALSSLQSTSYLRVAFALFQNSLGGLDQKRPD